MTQYAGISSFHFDSISLVNNLSQTLEDTLEFTNIYENHVNFFLDLEWKMYAISSQHYFFILIS